MSWGKYIRGARVELRYRNSQRRWVGRHGLVGTVQIVPRLSGGPINYGVLMDSGEGMVVVTRGNLRAYVPSKQGNLFGA